MTETEARDESNDAAEQTAASPVESSGYRVRVGEFEGPLDLLLHLVRINEVDITDIPIVKVTEQYNEYLEMMREMNLDIAGDYLLMAATLMHIKSRLLLPPDPDSEDEEADVDPRTELAQQLLEYERFKQAAENLQAMDSRQHLIWTREAPDSEYEGEQLLAVELFDLLHAFRKMLGRMGEEARLQLKRDNVSVADKITWLTDLLEQRESMELLALLEDLPTRLDRIATFLALLEMIRLHLVVAYQRKIGGEIRLTRGSAAESQGAKS